MKKKFLNFVFLIIPILAQAKAPILRDYTLHFVTKEKSLNEISFQYCKTTFGAQYFLREILKKNPDLDAYDELETGMAIKIPGALSLCPWRGWAWEFAAAAKGLKAIDQNGRTANINSSSFFHIQLAHEWHWNNRNVSKLGYKLAREEYIESDRRISSPSFFRSQFFARHEFTPRERIYSLEAGISQQTLLRDLQTHNLHLSVIPVPYIGHGWEFNVETFKRFRVQFGLMAKWLLPAGDSHLNLHPGYEGKAYFDLQTSAGNYTLFYSYTRQDSNFYKNSSDLLGLSYTMRFRGW